MSGIQVSEEGTMEDRGRRPKPAAPPPQGINARSSLRRRRRRQRKETLSPLPGPSPPYLPFPQAAQPPAALNLSSTKISAPSKFGGACHPRSKLSTQSRLPPLKPVAEVRCEWAAFPEQLAHEEAFSSRRHAAVRRVGAECRQQAAEWRRAQQQKLKEELQSLRSRVQQKLRDRDQTKRRPSVTAWSAILKNIDDRDKEAAETVAVITDGTQEQEQVTALDRRIEALRRARRKERRHKRSLVLQQRGNIDKGEIKKCKRAFDFYDEDESGHVHVRELIFALTELGLSGVTPEEKTAVTRCIKERLRKVSDDDTDLVCDFEAFAYILVPAVRELLFRSREDSFKIHLELVEGAKLDVRDTEHVEWHAQEVWPLTSGFQPVWTHSQNEDIEYVLGEMRRLAKALVHGSMTVHDFADQLSQLAEKRLIAVAELERQVQAERHAKESTFRDFRHEICELDRWFRRVDVDESGLLNGAEVRRVFKELGLIPKSGEERIRVERHLAHVTSVDFDNFLELVSEAREFREHQEDTELEQAITKYSHEEDFITTQGITRVLADIGMAPKDRAGQRCVMRTLAKEDSTGAGVFAVEEARPVIIKIEEALRRLKLRTAAVCARDLGFTEDEFYRIMGQFDSMDKDGSGTLQFDEIRAVMLETTDAPLVESDLRLAFRSVDHDNSGALDVQEFLAMSRAIKDRTGIFEGEQTKLDSWSDLSRDQLLKILRCGGVENVDMVADKELNILRVKAMDMLGVNPLVDIADCSNVSTVKDLYNMAANRVARSEMQRAPSV